MFIQVIIAKQYIEKCKFRYKVVVGKKFHVRILKRQLNYLRAAQICVSNVTLS